ncbi:MAG: glycosyltransferase [bacterium]
MQGLQKAGYEVVTCLPPDRAFKHYPKLLWQFLWKKRGCDLVVVGFYGQLLFPFVWLMTRKPLLYDVYISTYDTMVHDRGKGGERSLLARFFFWSDTLSMRLADRIILETRDHIRDYARKFGIPEKKFFHIFLATDDTVVAQRNGTGVAPGHSPENGSRPHEMNRADSPSRNEPANGTFLVHFHGEYAPFHGVQYILRAADLLRDENVHFQIIGRGITYERNMQVARDLKLRNCTFIEWVPYEELADYMSRAQACLGIFGENPRTLRVLTNKVIESIAVGKPLITARNEPVQELLEDGKSALLVERANPQAIADAILKLRDDRELRERIGKDGHEVYRKNCTLDIFSKRLDTVIREMLN